MDAIQAALWPKWNSKLPEIRAKAKATAADLGAEEAYLAGYRQAYWDAVVDMVDSGLLRMPQEPPPLFIVPQPVSDEYH